MGKPSRDKGYRVERELVLRLQEAGIEAERVPLSGGAGGSYTGDIKVRRPYRGDIPSIDWTAEVKARKGGDGFKTIEGWLGDNDVLFLKRNNAEPLVVLPWDRFVNLLKE